MEEKKKMLSYGLFEQIYDLLKLYKLYEKEKETFLSYGFTLKELNDNPQLADLKMYKDSLEDHIRQKEEDIILTREIRLLVKPENKEFYKEFVAKRNLDTQKDLMYMELMRIETILDDKLHSKYVSQIERKYSLRYDEVCNKDKLKVRDNALVKRYWDNKRKDFFKLEEIKKIMDLVAKSGEYSIFQDMYMNDGKKSNNVESIFQIKDPKDRSF